MITSYSPRSRPGGHVVDPEVDVAQTGRIGAGSATLHQIGGEVDCRDVPVGSDDPRGGQRAGTGAGADVENAIAQ